MTALDTKDDSRGRKPAGSKTEKIIENIKQFVKADHGHFMGIAWLIPI